MEQKYKTSKGETKGNIPGFAYILVCYEAIVADFFTFLECWTVRKVMQKEWPNFMP